MIAQQRSLLILSALLVATACGSGEGPSKPKKALAQKAEKLEVAKPKTAKALDFVIKSETSKVGFMMEAPVEKIRGKIPKAATTGQLNIDLADITKTTGIVHIDLQQLELFQRKDHDGTGTFGEETKNERQNEHARVWLEIDPSTPEEARKKNELIEFSLQKVDGVSASNVLEMKGDSRKITFEAEGEFLLHQRKSTKKVKMEATFKFTGDEVASVHVRSLEPFGVDLDEHDVRPRTAFGTLAQKTLSAMSPKVAQVAEISVDFSAEKKTSKVAAK